MSSDDVVIDVQGLGKRYEIYNSPRDRLKQLILPRLRQVINRLGVMLRVSRPHAPPTYFREFWALQGISFQIRRGESVGIIGRNGGGKSTLLQILAGTLAPTLGSVNVNGRIAALLELGSGFNPEFSGRENVFLNGRILGLTQKEIEARYDQIIEFADIGDFIDQPVKTYSSGMFVRLAFAVQAHIDASIVIIDEALAVGDVFFRQKCYARLEQLRQSGAAILLVSHSMPDIEQFCDRAILLDHGKQKFTGASSDAAKHYYLLNQPAINTAPVQPSVKAKESDESMLTPLSVAFQDVSAQSQIGNGQARCTRVAICNANGEPCNSFRQGDLAVFYYEFELLEDIGVPIGGLLLRNDRGTIVHGKNAWQYKSDVPGGTGAGSRLICRHEISLQLAPGEYTFELGLAAVTASDWESRYRISHEEWSARYQTVCVLTNAGQLTIGLAATNGVSFLTHHGIADLPGQMFTELIK